MLIVNQRVGFGQKGSVPAPDTIYLVGNNVDAYVAAGSPEKAATLTYVISPGVVIGSDSKDQPALHFPDNFELGTIINLIFYGRVQGAGGKGGNAGTYIDKSNFVVYAGGGGGAGTVPGVGGTGDESGQDGTASAGGAGGIFQVGGAGLTYLTSGDAGGVALKVDRAITITQGGVAEIWGGGGGGGGRYLDVSQGGDGGDPGQAGANATSTGGAAGAAIDGVSNVTKVGTFDIQGSEIN